MSGEIAGKGSEFRRWNSGTGAWESLSKIKTISGPTMSRNTYDTTAIDTVGGYMTFIAGLRDPGTITFTMNFGRTEYDLMKADFESDVLKDYEIVLPDTENTSFEFQGLVTELPLNIPANEVVTCDISIKISGQVTVNSGSGPSPGA